MGGNSGQALSFPPAAIGGSAYGDAISASVAMGSGGVARATVVLPLVTLAPADRAVPAAGPSRSTAGLSCSTVHSWSMVATGAKGVWMEASTWYPAVAAALAVASCCRGT